MICLGCVRRTQAHLTSLLRANHHCPLLGPQMSKQGRGAPSGLLQEREVELPHGGRLLHQGGVGPQL